MKTDPSRLAVLVHEVRSPVAALGAIAETFQQESEPAALRELSRLAVAACRAIDRLVTDWAPDSVSSDRVDVATLVRDAVAGVARNGVDVDVRIDPDVTAVDADAVRLRQALDNLLANAVQHGGGLGIVVDVARATASFDCRWSIAAPAFRSGTRSESSTRGSASTRAVRGRVSAWGSRARSPRLMAVHLGWRRRAGRARRSRLRCRCPARLAGHARLDSRLAKLASVIGVLR